MTRTRARPEPLQFTLHRGESLVGALLLQALPGTLVSKRLRKSGLTANSALVLHQMRAAQKAK
jgi:hypothetical protein